MAEALSGRPGAIPGGPALLRGGVSGPSLPGKLEHRWNRRGDRGLFSGSLGRILRPKAFGRDRASRRPGPSDEKRLERSGPPDRAGARSTRGPGRFGLLPRRMAAFSPLPISGFFGRGSPLPFPVRSPMARFASRCISAGAAPAGLAGGVRGAPPQSADRSSKRRPERVVRSERSPFLPGDLLHRRAGGGAPEAFGSARGGDLRIRRVFRGADPVSSVPFGGAARPLS